MSSSRAGSPLSREAAATVTAPLQPSPGFARLATSSPPTAWLEPLKSCSVLLASKPTRERFGRMLQRCSLSKAKARDGSVKLRKPFVASLGTSFGGGSALGG